jgi:endonuclease YncB( thermonuclease family)
VLRPLTIPWEAAGESLFKMTNKKDIMGVVEYRTGGKRDIPLKLKVTLMMGKKIVQEELLNEGVVRLRPRENTPGAGRIEIKTWKDAQEKAKRARVNMWRQGDPGDSEDEAYYRN